MPINALEYPSTRYKCFIVVGMKTLFILIVVGLMVVTARAAEIQGGMEIYTPAYFNSLIMKDKTTFHMIFGSTRLPTAGVAFMSSTWTISQHHRQKTLSH
jgi:hypothetical protein